MNAEELARRRLRAMKLLKTGRRPADVALELCVSRGAVEIVRPGRLQGPASQASLGAAPEIDHCSAEAALAATPPSISLARISLVAAAGPETDSARVWRFL